MKPPTSLIARIVLHAVCWLALLGAVRGQAVTILHSFGEESVMNEQGAVVNDGVVPDAAMIQGADGNFYGTTQTGGAAGRGCVFVMTSQGALTILHSFGDDSVTNDGANPTSSLVRASSGTLYGTTSSGGSAGKGTVFSITSTGAVNILHSFGDGTVTADGASPQAGLIQGADHNLYGTTQAGGSAGLGCVFEITSSGAVTILHSFGDGTVNNDGVSPTVGLVQDAQGNFYGTTYNGGSDNQGAVYVINSQKQVSILYSFSLPNYITFDLSTTYNNANGAGGAYPNSRLTLGSDGNLYGTTATSVYGYGTIFKITPQGEETILHYFGDGTVANDGQEPPPGSPQTIGGENELLQASDGNFYGTTSAGGSAGQGALFEMTPQGQVTILHSFQDGTVASDGIAPGAGVIQGTDGNFYGTTSGGGQAGLGSIFQVVPEVPAITSSLAVNGAVGLAFSYQIAATQTPISYSTSVLPPGLNLDNSTGIIGGTPTATGTSDVTITVGNGAGSNSATLVITILPPPVITSILYEFGSTTAPFAYQIRASGSPTNFGTSVLPGGLSLNATTGVISGTPTVTGTFPITLSATNIAGSGSATLTLLITSAAPTFSQEYVQLHSFGDGSTNSDGPFPNAIIPGRDNTLYGVTAQGGGNGFGAIFNVSAAGNASVFSAMDGANGSAPQGLVQGSDGSFYGTTQNGGSANLGTVFQVTPDGNVRILHNFGDGKVTNDGANPQCGLIPGADGNYYGTTQNGGEAGEGTVFKMTPQGAVTIIHSFGDGSVMNDGAQPVASLVQDSGTGIMYGTTMRGGVTVTSNTGNLGLGSQTTDGGTVFSLSPGGEVKTLHSFGDGSVANDGQWPHAALVDVNGNLYGTTYVGGTIGKGTLFQVKPAGTVTILHNFGDGSVTNDGINPIGAIIAFTPATSGTMIFGTTQNGGAAGQGAVFELDASGNLTILHSFDDGTVTNDGTLPLAGLCLGTDGNLYGTTMGGGNGYGTLFAIATNLLPPSATSMPDSYWKLTGSLPLGMTFDSSSGNISGAPLSGDASGTYTVSLGYVSDGVETIPQTFLVNLNGQPTVEFETWAQSHLLTGPSDTPQHDGISNIMKYLFDIDPTGPMSAADRAALPVMNMMNEGGKQYLTLTYRQYALMTGVTVHLESSSDLQTWSSVNPPDYAEQIGSDPITNDPIMQIGVRTNGAARQFIRLNITSP